MLNVSNTTNSFLYVNENNGNTGIGTQSPTSKLQVEGTFNATYNSGMLYLDSSGNIKIGI